MNTTIFLFRYLAICHPFMVRRDPFDMSVRQRRCTRRNLSTLSIRHNVQPRKRFYKYSIIVLMISIMSTIPIFFEFETITDSESETPQLEITNLRTNSNYILFYKNGFEGIFLVVLPFAMMLCLNAKMIYQMANARNLRSFGSERRAKKEMNLAKVLIAMDLAFVICNLGRVIVNMWEIFHAEGLKKCLQIDSEYKVR